MIYALHGGFQKCGTTLLSSILDAHPNVICPMRTEDFIEKYSPGMSRDEIVNEFCDASRKDKYREHDTYVYRIPGQGEWNEIKVLSHKSGWLNAILALKDLDQIKNHVDKLNMPTKLIISSRNPYSMVEGIWSWKTNRRVNRPLNEIIDELEEACIGNNILRDNFKDSFIVRLDTLINSPSVMMRELANFLEVDANEEWIGNCSSILFDKERSRPREMNLAPTWTEDNKSRIVNLIKTYQEYFSSYEFPN